ncbi:hypothetical protein BDN72DRAFT_753826 [Pluteus cervinus]|uniref:Uncharacterized protein n=1 Tax=Pluteus cervinus TaxID=181527 RepID=A0ACD3BI08_9AGAR|nr:hypothetical protein BDN72DRAFT_753826 [Pluteus cervinus]
MRTSSLWSQTLVFPTIWSTIAFIVSFISPAGRLLTWSPVQGLGAYQWMLPTVGTIGIDWVMAAWALVCSQVAEAWLMGDESIEDDGLLLAPDAPARLRVKPHPTRQASIILSAILVTLALPSLLLNELPLPTPYPTSTPLSVGCVIPSFERYKHHVPTLDDYISESQRLTNSARVLLWPESAVQFSSEEERDQAFAKVRTEVTGSYVGVSFEEAYTLPGEKRSSKRTGVALISKASPEPHMMYYKRHLVPIAESFSLTHSTVPPSIYTIDLTHPKEVNKTDWAPAPNYTRPIPVTASICLDFAAPLPFSDLNSRPALILAPARTWHLSIGFAMWQQAKRRAEELGSTLLWCDGGAGGVSGIAGQGYDQVIQVGPGSWIQNIEIQYPFDDRRTTFAYLGWFIVSLLWFATLADSVEFVYLPFVGSFAAGRRVLDRVVPQNQAQQNPNLLD